MCKTSSHPARSVAIGADAARKHANIEIPQISDKILSLRLVAALPRTKTRARNFPGSSCFFTSTTVALSTTCAFVKMSRPGHGFTIALSKLHFAISQLHFALSAFSKAHSEGQGCGIVRASGNESANEAATVACRWVCRAPLASKRCLQDSTAECSRLKSKNLQVEIKMHSCDGKSFPGFSRARPNNSRPRTFHDEASAGRLRLTESEGVISC